MTASQFDTIMLILRVIAGPTIFLHGYNKMFRGGKIPGTAGWFDSMGMKPNGKVHAYVAACNEMGCGVLILLGLLTPLAAAGVIGTMVVAGWTVHRHAFFIVKEGWEYNLVLAVAAVAIAGLGAGRYSLDHLLFSGTEVASWLSGWCGLAIAAGLGLLGGIGQLVIFFRPPAKTS